MTEPQYAGPLAKKLENIKKMRKAGYTDKDIVDTIMESGEVPVGKIKKMREGGITDEGIIHFLVTGNDLPLPDPARTFSRGMAVGASQVAGAPSDIFEFVVNRTAEQSAKRGGLEKPQQLDVPLGSDVVKSGINKLAGDNYAYNSLEDLPASDRPVAAAGEVLGGNVAVGGGLYTASKAGMLGNAGQQILRHPKTLAMVEGGSTLGAMQGAALGEALDPGGYGRIVGELGGGFANPLGIIYRLGAKTVGGATNFLQSLTTSGRYDRASILLRGALEEAGEDPGAIARELRKRGVKLDVTSGQKTGSPTLLLLEQKLKQESSKFGRDAAEKMEKAMEDMRYMIAALSDSKNPDLLRHAAQMRKDYIDGLIEGRLELVKTKLTEARARFPGQRNLAVPSENAYQVLESALDDARAIEKTEYWDKVDGTVPVDSANNILSKFTELKKRVLKVPSDKLPPLIKEQVRRIKLISGDLSDEIGDFVEDGLDRPAAIEKARKSREKELKKGPFDAGELIVFRSRMLEEARVARSQKNWRDASLYEQMASATLDDLAEINAPGYDEAREFSRRLNETFSQTFAGKALATGKEGGDTINPGLMLERAFAGSGEKGAIQFNELEAAARFSNKSMMEEQEDFLRQAATVSRKDGAFNPQALGNFLEKNQVMLERFPQLKADLMDVRRAEQVLSNIEGNLKTSFRMRQRAALEQLIEAEDSSRYVGRLFRGLTPQKDYAELVKTAKAAGPGAMGGLKNVTLDYAYNSALKADGTIDVSKYKQSLFAPVSNKGPSPIEMMTRNGVMTKREAVQLRRIVNEMEKIQKSIATGADISKLGISDGIFDLFVRVTGARIGAKLGEGGSSLLAASRGSEYARQIFEKVPATRIRDVFIEAAESPEIMAMLLERKPSPKRQIEIAKRIRVWLKNAGLTAPSKMEGAEPGENVKAPKPKQDSWEQYYGT